MIYWLTKDLRPANIRQRRPLDSLVRVVDMGNTTYDVINHNNRGEHVDADPTHLRFVDDGKTLYLPSERGDLELTVITPETFPDLEGELDVPDSLEWPELKSSDDIQHFLKKHFFGYAL